MRKLLIASQKSGVGKTTTAINLAIMTAKNGSRVLLVDVDPVGSVSMALNLSSHAQRQTLQEWGFDLAGDVCRSVVEGLDAISPYDEGIGSDEDLQKLLDFLGSDTIKDRYDCIILNTEPFIGERPEKLLKTCDELLLVIRAESMAFKTLPLFLEMVKTIDSEDNAGLRGILLTLPEEGRWETDLRRYLGSKALPQTIPNDPEVPRAESSGIAVTLANPASPAAVQYVSLSASLDLARDVPLPARQPKQAAVTTAKANVAKVGAIAENGSAMAGSSQTLSDSKQTANPAVPGKLAARNRHSTGASPRWWATTNRTRSSRTSRRETMARRETPVSQPKPPDPVKEHPATPPPPTPTPPIRSITVEQKSLAKWLRPWHLWLGAGMTMGVVLGTVPVPTHFLPIGVGLATAGGAVLVLRIVLTRDSAKMKNNKRQKMASPPELPDLAERDNGGDPFGNSAALQRLR